MENNFHISNKSKEFVMTPYAVHVKLNKALKEAGIDKEVPPQQLYNYRKQGYLPATVVDGKWSVTEADADAFVAKYVQAALKVLAHVEAGDEIVSEGAEDEPESSISFEIDA